MPAYRPVQKQIASDLLVLRIQGYLTNDNAYQSHYKQFLKPTLLVKYSHMYVFPDKGEHANSNVFCP